MRMLLSITSLIFTFCLISCNKNSGGEVLDPLQIKFFYQDADTIGATIIIVGQGFSLTPSNNSVTFNSTSTHAFHSSHDTILVTVPWGATTGKIQISVQSQTAISKDSFYVVTGHWKKISDLPMLSSNGVVGFAVGNKGYVVGWPNKYLFEYDAVTNTWTRKTDFPGTYPGYAFTINDKVYVGGPSENNSIPNELYEYDATLNSWTTKTALPLPIHFIDGLATAINGKGYILPTYYVDIIWQYDPQAETWTRKTDFRGGSRTQSAAFVIGSKAYMTGGWANGSINENWEYNPSIDNWLQKTSLPETIYQAIGFSINGYGFVGGGDSRNHLWMYDVTKDNWQRKTNIPRQGRAHFVINGKAYIVGYNQDKLTNEFWQFEP